MAALTWTAAYQSGITGIDRQHQKLFDLINRFCDALGHGHGAEVLQGILEELKDYAGYHFQTEESAMAQSHYPQLAAHQLQHQVFIERISTWQAAPQASLETGLELLNFLGNWLIVHIKSQDLDYVPWLKQAGQDRIPD